MVESRYKVRTVYLVYFAISLYGVCVCVCSHMHAFVYCLHVCLCLFICMHSCIVCTHGDVNVLMYVCTHTLQLLGKEEDAKDIHNFSPCSFKTCIVY